MFKIQIPFLNTICCFIYFNKKSTLIDILIVIINMRLSVQHTIYSAVKLWVISLNFFHRHFSRFSNSFLHQSLWLAALSPLHLPCLYHHQLHHAHHLILAKLGFYHNSAHLCCYSCFAFGVFTTYTLQFPLIWCWTSLEMTSFLFLRVKSETWLFSLMFEITEHFSPSKNNTVNEASRL